MNGEWPFATHEFVAQAQHRRIIQIEGHEASGD